MSAIERWVERARIAMVVGSLGLAVAGLAVHLRAAEPASSESARYHCPMHPEIRSATPGVCPVCSMQLEPIPTRPSEPPVPIDGGLAALPQGHALVELTADRARQLGVETAPVERGVLSSAARYAGTVQAVEGRVDEVRVRAGAFVESLRVGRVGERVRRGQPLLTVFSPELARTEDELAALTRVDPALAAEADVARRRLGARGSAPGTAAVRGRLTLHAPRAGVVTRLEARVGGFAGPEMVLVEITALDALDVVASVPAAALEPLRAGAQVEVFGSTLAATVVLVAPSVDPTTRRLDVRLRLEQVPEGLLPGMPAVVTATGPLGEGLRIPTDAVVDDGSLRVVYVDRGFGTYEPRRVELGAADGVHVLVTGGLAEGERVVRRGTFLLDSESRLRGLGGADR